MIDLLDRRAVRVLTTALIFVGVLFFIYRVRETLILFLFALLFAYLFEPVVCRVQPLVRNSSALAILIVYILLFLHPDDDRDTARATDLLGRPEARPVAAQRSTRASPAAISPS